MVNPSILDQKQRDNQFSYSGSEDEEIVKILESQEESCDYETPGTPGLRYSLSSHATSGSILNGGNARFRSKDFLSCVSTFEDEQHAVQSNRSKGRVLCGNRIEQTTKVGLKNDTKCVQVCNDEQIGKCKPNIQKVKVGSGRDVDGGGDADGIKNADENVSTRNNFRIDTKTCQDIYSPGKATLRNPKTLRKIKKLLEKMKSKTKVTEGQRCEKVETAEDQRRHDISEIQNKTKNIETKDRSKQHEIAEKSLEPQRIEKPLKHLKPLGNQIQERSDSLQRTKRPLKLEVSRKSEKSQKHRKSKQKLEQAISDDYPWEYIDVIRRHRTSHVTLWKTKPSENEPPPKWQVVVGQVPTGQAAQKKNFEHKNIDDESKMKIHIASQMPDFALTALLHETDTRKEQSKKTFFDDVMRNGPKSHQRKCWSFTNERTREIERQNKILLEKILKPRSTIPRKAKKSKLPPTKIATYNTVSREEEQRQIEQDNHVMRKRIAAIAVRKPKLI